MADSLTVIFAGVGVIVSAGVAFNTLMNRRYEIRQAAFDALQEAYDALALEHRQLKEEHLILQAALVKRVMTDGAGRGGGGNG